MVGLFGMIMLFALLVERGLRTAIGAREGFGKLLAGGLAFTVACSASSSSAASPGSSR